MQNQMRHNPKLWKKRPLSQGLINYAIGDVLPLLSLADKLTAELGKCQLQLLARLSLNYSQTFWLPVDKGKSKGSAHGRTFGLASLFFLGIGLHMGSSGSSWLAPLFFIDEGKASTTSCIQQFNHGHCACKKWPWTHHSEVLSNKSQVETSGLSYIYAVF